MHTKNYGNLLKLKKRRDCVEGAYEEAHMEVEIGATKIDDKGKRGPLALS